MTNQQQPQSDLPTLSVYLNFIEGECLEAFEFYRHVFGGEFSTVMTFDDMPPPDESDAAGGDDSSSAMADGEMAVPDGWGDKVMHVSLPIGNGVLMGSDVPPGFGPPLTVGSNYSVSYRPPSREEADRVFAGLSDGGVVTMELQDMFWGDYFGSCTDRFGINWQVSLENEAAS